MSTPRPADLEYIGHIVDGRWTVLRLLGVGGMGSVYQAQDRQTQEYVALKRLRPEYIRDAEVVRRFVREAQSGAQMVHPNIANVRASGQDPADGSLYIVQEYLTGLDLRQRMTGGRRMAPREAVDIILPIIDGLSCAHSFGIVHRDIKPANLFLAVGADGTVIPKVIDFGVSKVLGPMSEGLSMTRTGIAVGTPQYMSPEQLRGEKGIDEGIDIWAVGVVLYLMLSGRHPFQAEDSAHIMLNIISTEPPRLDRVAPQVSRALADIVHRALAKNRAERFATMADFHRALAACALGVNTSAGYANGTAQADQDSQSRERDQTVVGGSAHAPPDAQTVIDGVFKGDSSPSMPAPILPQRPSSPPGPPDRTLLFVGAGLLVVALGALGLALRTARHDPSATPPNTSAPTSGQLTPTPPPGAPPVTRLR